ncbi:hypothetical protein [Sinorhizobium fredii]|uniref:hypothetical protein n=1 Tax=Rhizobium fredii TaxID=380 RepID=UPI00056B8C94|nr:hypothetical protein [Sinorhizobium fredii]
MPEFMGVKITRSQESARHAYCRALEKAVRAAARGTGWRPVQGCLLREQSGWFVSVNPSVAIFEETTKALVSAKPMEIDPLFWDMVGLTDNNKAPLSFRFNGVWSLRPPYFSEIEISEDQDTSLVAGRLLCAADEQFARVVEGWSKEAFLHACIASNEQSAGSRYLACVITTLVALGRSHEALIACDEARTKGLEGGFLAPQGSFTHMASDWIRASLAKATRH